MKITSGEYKYRKLEIPEGIRPTTEKVREAIFSMIRDWIPYGICVDLFAGSGALGLEALSRGAARCYFNEGNRKNFKVLKANILNCKAEDKSVVSNNDFRTSLANISEKVDVILVDPPYNDGYYEEIFHLINKYELMDEGGIVVTEHLNEKPLQESYGRLVRLKQKKYGTIAVNVYIAE